MKLTALSYSPLTFRIKDNIFQSSNELQSICNRFSGRDNCRERRFLKKCCEFFLLFNRKLKYLFKNSLQLFWSAFDGAPQHPQVKSLGFCRPFTNLRGDLLHLY